MNLIDQVVDKHGLKTHPVSQKQPNAWGLYDMGGNVSEWCLDIAIAEGGYPKESTDPLAKTEDPIRRKLKRFRGGHFVGLPSQSACSWRGGGAIDDRIPFIGFRVVLERENWGQIPEEMTRDTHQIKQLPAVAEVETKSEPSETDNLIRREILANFEAAKSRIVDLDRVFVEEKKDREKTKLNQQKIDAAYSQLEVFITSPRLLLERTDIGDPSEVMFGDPGRRVIDPRPADVTGSRPLKVGQIGFLPGSSRSRPMIIAQVVDKTAGIARISRTFEKYKTVTFLVSGVNLENAVDGIEYSTDDLFRVTGTETYTTVAGGTNTVFVLSRVDIPACPELKPIYDEFLSGKAQRQNELSERDKQRFETASSQFKSSLTNWDLDGALQAYETRQNIMSQKNNNTLRRAMSETDLLELPEAAKEPYELFETQMNEIQLVYDKKALTLKSEFTETISNRLNNKPADLGPTSKLQAEFVVSRLKLPVFSGVESLILFCVKTQIPDLVGSRDLLRKLDLLVDERKMSRQQSGLAFKAKVQPVIENAIAENRYYEALTVLQRWDWHIRRVSPVEVMIAKTPWENADVKGLVLDSAGRGCLVQIEGTPKAFWHPRDLVVLDGEPLPQKTQDLGKDWKNMVQQQMKCAA